MSELESEQEAQSDIQFSPGSLLKQARERANISIEDVAQKLKLTRQTINSIENDDYSLDLPVTFYRGYLRNYAELLKIGGDDIVENFNNYCQRNNLYTKADESYAAIKLEKPLTSRSWLIKTITILIVLLLLFGLYYLLMEKKVWQTLSSAEAGAGAEQATLPIADDGAVVLPVSGMAEQANVNRPATEESLLDDSASVQEQSVATVSDSDQAEPEVTTVTQENPQALSNAELVLVFSDDCWVRIEDASGKVLALGIKRAGTNLSLSGQAPIELTLGKPSAVQLSYLNTPVDLSGYPDTRAARLTLGN